MAVHLFLTTNLKEKWKPIYKNEFHNTLICNTFAYSLEKGPLNIMPET